MTTIRFPFLRFLTLLAVSSSGLLTSCVSNHWGLSGVLTYSASSPDFKVADEIDYKDEEGKLVKLTNVELPWSLSIVFQEKRTYSIDPAIFKVIVHADRNLSGGKLTTFCILTPPLLNHKDIVIYQAGAEIRQVGWARLFPNRM